MTVRFSQIMRPRREAEGRGLQGLNKLYAFNYYRYLIKTKPKKAVGATKLDGLTSAELVALGIMLYAHVPG